MQEKQTAKSLDHLFTNVCHIIEEARSSAYRAVNFAMVKAYWSIGRLVVEEEMQGSERAGYGKFIISNLSQRLQTAYGKGFDESNLWYMSRFYRAFQILDALRPELSLTHYRMLLKVDKQSARDFYLEEAIESRWSTRTLERQINSLYYERMLMSGTEGRPAVKQEAEGKKEVMQPQHFIKDPYVLEFLLSLIHI